MNTKSMDVDLINTARELFFCMFCAPQFPRGCFYSGEGLFFYYPNTPSQPSIYKLLEIQSLKEMKAKKDVDKFSSVFLISTGKSAIFSRLFVKNYY